MRINKKLLRSLSPKVSKLRGEREETKQQRADRKTALRAANKKARKDLRVFIDREMEIE